MSSNRLRATRARVAACGVAALAVLPLPLAGTAEAGARDLVPAPAPLAAHAAPAAALVLGSAAYAPNGQGWGTTRPRRLDNGGVPSGILYRIHWTRWGGAVAIGHGLNPLYAPRGGYYRRPGRAILRATRVGTCEDGGPRAYTHLWVRVAVRPGGPLGRWFRWGGSGGVCSWE